MGLKNGQSGANTANCEHCDAPCHGGAKCCWATAMAIKRFQHRVKHKYIFEVIFDLIVSTTSVSTDIIALILYFSKRKYSFALLTAIPVLLPTFVFTNVYLADESSSRKKKPVSRVISTISGNDKDEKSRRSSFAAADAEETSWRGKVKPQDLDDSESNFDTVSTDSSIMSMENKGGRCRKKCFFHWPCLKLQLTNCGSCFSGCIQCFCNPDHRLRRSGAIAVKNSLQRLFKYGFGTFVLRFIAWMWYVKALIFGVKAYRQPKKFMHIAAPDTHWSYELLIRLDFLQAALENAPQCVIQLYALTTQPDEDVVLGLLTLTLSFVDFIRVAVSVHWDMNKGPVTAPTGIYRSLIWKFLNTASWIFIYSSRSCALALVFATTGINKWNPMVFFPLSVLAIHILIFGKILSKAEYGVAAQKIFVTVFISLFFLPELDSSVLPQTIQFYYATIIIQNTFFIIPWNDFDQEYCITSGSFMERQKPPTPAPTPPPPVPPTPRTTMFPNTTSSHPKIMQSFLQNITASPTTTEASHIQCLIDPLWMTLAVPTMTIFGVIFRLVSSQRMYKYKIKLSGKDKSRAQDGQNKMETSISKLFSRNWTQMTAKEMLQAFLRMLRKEVIILEKGRDDDEDNNNSNVNDHDRAVISKRFSFLTGRLQADFLASQTFIRQSFSLMTRTTRSHDINIGELMEKSEEHKDEPPSYLDYNSDSELTFRKKNGKKRPRMPRSRNVSESVEANTAMMQDATVVQVDFPNGAQFLEMCWI